MSWKPSSGDRWQYQLESTDRRRASTGGINVGICQVPYSGGHCVHPDVFDIDLYVDGQVSGNDHTVDAKAVDAIHRRGAHAVCYMSAGTAERFRPDYDKYVAFDKSHRHSLIGKPFSRRFPNEYWLNLKNGSGQRDFVLRRVEARTEKCARAGFDGVEYDVVDAYAQGHRVTGWHVSAHDQLVFDRALARSRTETASRSASRTTSARSQSSSRGSTSRSTSSASSTASAPTTLPGYKAFLRAGKPVFQVEYRVRSKRFCPKAEDLGIDSIKKASDFSLDANRGSRAARRSRRSTCRLESACRGS